MASGIIENAEELKNLYVQTDITNVAAVQTTVKEISENVYVAGKEKYLEALNAATPANISKARKYAAMASGEGIKPLVLKNLGWIVMAVFAIWMGVQDWADDATWQSLGFWVGVGVQIYIAVLKSAWNKLTLSGSVMHPMLMATATPVAEKNSANKVNANKPASLASEEKEVKHVFCPECGRKNKEGASFCEHCGTKL